MRIHELESPPSELLVAESPPGPRFAVRHRAQRRSLHPAALTAYAVLSCLVSRDEWIHLVHIVASMLWVGGLVTLIALSTQIRRVGDGDAVGRFLGSLRVVGPVVLAPGPLLLLATGVWSVTRNDGWGFGQTWIWLALVLLGGAFLFGAAFQSRVAIRAERAATAGDTDGALRLLSRWTWGSVLILALVLVATWDMVAKPGL